MSSLVVVNTYTHSVTFLTDKMLTSLKRIVVWSGLDPRKLTSDWEGLDRGLKTWLGRKELVTVTLEVFRAGTEMFVGGWEFAIEYDLNGDGEMWTDTEAIRHAIKKCGLEPASCGYRIIVTTKANAAAVEGWGPATLLSRDGFVRHSVGTTIGASPLGARTSYWRKQ